MSNIQSELDRISEALRAKGGNEDGQYAQLYAAQQALSWALEPEGFKSPYDLVTGTPADSGDCSDPLHLPQS